MTIEEAMKALTEILELGHEDWMAADYNAINLAIEGLKEIKRNRDNAMVSVKWLLPGETKKQKRE